MIPTKDILNLFSKRLMQDHYTDSCVIFNGYKNKEGYGQFQFWFNKIKYNISAHRAAYIIFNNKDLITENVIMHSCDNPSCINPLHLKLGTHNDNVKDRVIKNRSAIGSKNGRFIHGKNCKNISFAKE